MGRTILDLMNDRKKLSAFTFNWQSLRKHESDFRDPVIDTNNILFPSESRSNEEENGDIPHLNGLDNLSVTILDQRDYLSDIE